MMVKGLWTAAVVLLLFLSAVGAVAQQDVLTGRADDGRRVLLFPNGTWMFVEATDQTEAAIPLCATSDRIPAVQVCFDEEVWSEVPSPNQEHEKTFVHSKSDAYAILITERIQMPLSSLKTVALSNLKDAGATKITIISERNFTQDGIELYAMSLEGVILDIPFYYDMRFWTGESGTVQFIAYTGRNLAREFQQDFVHLLDGLRVPRD